ncbi:cupin domain-containing protein [Streptomyces mirabilis]|uniref:cupin domain-containing protein n=1 Tax=Streptomyces mirabilis TaxID=68239 RepID=UPI0036C1DF9E
MESTRYIVTGHNEAGKAVFVEDGDSPFVQEIMGSTTVDFWQVMQTPADNVNDYFKGGAELPPPANGSVFRVVEFSPETPCVMHRTATVDYGYVVSGEIHLVLDGEERLLKAGDAIVQRGTIHGWDNRSDQPCVVVFVLVDAEPLPGLPLV